MKKEHGFLIASISFFIAAIAVFVSEMEDKVMFMGAFATLGISFMAIFANYRRKNNRS